MASKTEEVSNAFVFTWLIENFPYSLEQCDEPIISPTFNLIDGSEWSVSLYPRGKRDVKRDYISCYLRQESDNSESIVLGFKLELLDTSGMILQSYYVQRYEYTNPWGFGSHEFELMSNIYDERRRDFLPNNVLTFRCRIWKPEENSFLGGQCLARTRIGTKSSKVLWEINEFTSVSSQAKGMVVPRIKDEEPRSISFNLTKSGDTCCKETYDIEISVEDFAKKQLLVCAFKLLDCKDAIVLSKEKQIWLHVDENQTTWNIASFVDKKKLMWKKAEYFPDDTLKILCEITTSKGVMYNEIEKYEPHQLSHHSDTLTDKSKIEDGVLNDLKYDLLQVFTNGILSDVSLQSGTDTFPAHKVHLSARSAVFEAMFTTDMKEKTLRVVSIEDLDADTIRRLLLYIYCDSVENLDVDSSKKLYYAADKYQISLLQRKCADYLLEKLTVDNVCEILVADSHQDAYLKKSVFEFILDHLKEIMDSDEWRTLMENKSQLTSEVMYAAIMS